MIDEDCSVSNEICSLNRFEMGTPANIFWSQHPAQVPHQRKLALTSRSILVSRPAPLPDLEGGTLHITSANLLQLDR